MEVGRRDALTISLLDFNEPSTESVELERKLKRVMAAGCRCAVLTWSPSVRQSQWQRRRRGQHLRVDCEWGTASSQHQCVAQSVVSMLSCYEGQNCKGCRYHPPRPPGGSFWGGGRSCYDLGEASWGGVVQCRGRGALWGSIG